MICFNASWAKLIRNAMVIGSYVLAFAFPGFTGIDSAWGTTLQFEDQRIKLTKELAAFPLAIDGDTALVGAFMLKRNESDAVYIFQKVGTQWGQKQELKPWDENVTCYFKHFSAGLMYRSLAIDGDVAMVPGYPIEKEITRGAIYVFRWNGTSWIKDQKITFADNSQQFDGPLALHGDLAVLGGWKSDGQQSIRAVYVFRKMDGTWTEEQMLLPSVSSPQDFFGHEVAISDDHDMVVVGSGFYGPLASVDPAVYVFRRKGGTWIETQRLIASDGRPTGHAVALSGGWLFASNPVGAYDERAEGSVTVFRWNGSAWVERQTLLASDSYSFNNFGNVVDISGDVAVIGADIEPANGSPYAGYGGQAYIFRLINGVWREEKKLVSSEALAESSGVQSFGSTAVIDADTALVSAVTLSVPGGAYTYSLSSGGGCGCSSEASDYQATAQHSDDSLWSIEMPWLLGVLLVPLVLSIGIHNIYRKRKKNLTALPIEHDHRHRS